MASTYSNLKIELIGTGDQTGSWGITTNTNLGTAIEEAIVGSADVTFSSADVTVTLTNTNAAQTARNLRLNLTGTSGGARNLILGSGCQIEKPYLINNGCADAVTVKNTTGTGITVPAGKSMWVYNNGTNVVDAVTHLSSLTLGSALDVASGGTGAATLTANNVILGNGTSAVQFVAPGSTGNVLTSNGTTWTSAIGTSLSANNAFTGANTFYNATGQTFAPATTNDGIIIQGRAGGSSTYRVTFTTATLSANRTLTFPDATDTAAVIGTAQTFTAAQTFRATNAIRSEAASTQDAVVIAGRAGGTSSYAVTLTPATLSASRTVTLPDGGGNYTVGYINLPPVGTKTGSYTLAVGDVGKYVQISTGGSIVIPTSTFAEGDAITLFNNTTGTRTITCSALTTYVAGIDSVKTSITLAARGVATILFYSATACVVSGNVT